MNCIIFVFMGETPLETITHARKCLSELYVKHKFALAPPDRNYGIGVILEDPSKKAKAAQIQSLAVSTAHAYGLDAKISQPEPIDGGRQAIYVTFVEQKEAQVLVARRDKDVVNFQVPEEQ